MNRVPRAPNRVLDLEELDRPDYRRVLASMDALLAQNPVCYLHPSKRWEYPWAIERAALAPGSRVLDAGCGASIFPIYLAETLAHRVIAVDLEFRASPSINHGTPLQYLQADAARLPFASGSFDTAFCISVIEHLPEERIPLVLRELRRVLRPHGRLLLTTDYYETATAELWYHRAGHSFPVDWTVFDERRLQRLILDAPGFTVEGAIDLLVDWDDVRPVMRRFHGYPYTAVGVALVRC